MTATPFESTGTVPKPLMPQGVEHPATDRQVERLKVIRVPKPLMPQGVEHGTPPIVSRTLERVPKPLMPQGVEHQRLGIWVGRSEVGS